MPAPGAFRGVSRLSSSGSDGTRSFVSTVQPSERDVVDVVYLPYLALRERITVGEWDLIPRAVLAEDDCVDARTIELAQGLGAVYVLPAKAGTAAGALARSRGRRVGDEIASLPDLRDLRDTVPCSTSTRPLSRLRASAI